MGSSLTGIHDEANERARKRKAEFRALREAVLGLKVGEVDMTIGFLFTLYRVSTISNPRSADIEWMQAVCDSLGLEVEGPLPLHRWDPSVEIPQKSS